MNSLKDFKLGQDFYISDLELPDAIDNIQILKRFGKRKITHAFHDIDGTHSLIRDWPPVMSLILYYVISTGLPTGYDDDDNVIKLVEKVGKVPLEETDRFCVESAGLSAITQMEWAVRRAIEEGSIFAESLALSKMELETNSEIIKHIWRGHELFDHMGEPEHLKEYLKEHSSRLFRLYEKVLNEACRNENIISALKNPEKWLVKGSMDFIGKLYDMGAKNYFITGAVVQINEEGQIEGGMYDEVCALGFEIGPGRMVEAIYGSTWNNKMPKAKVMEKLCKDEKIEPANVLVVGDGRSEISAGVAMNAITMSRLPSLALSQRELHKRLGTNIIVSDYSSKYLYKMFK